MHIGGVGTHWPIHVTAAPNGIRQSFEKIAIKSQLHLWH